MVQHVHQGVDGLASADLGRTSGPVGAESGRLDPTSFGTHHDMNGLIIGHPEAEKSSRAHAREAPADSKRRGDRVIAAARDDP